MNTIQETLEAFMTSRKPHLDFGGNIHSRMYTNPKETETGLVFEETASFADPYDALIPLAEKAAGSTAVLEMYARMTKFDEATGEADEETTHRVCVYLIIQDEDTLVGVARQDEDEMFFDDSSEGMFGQAVKMAIELAHV